jgi:transposase-like protein
METSETGGMRQPPDPHYRHRFPAEIISHAVWLYHVFSLSLRDVELLLAHSGDLERSFRSIMNTGSGDHEHPHEPA